MSRTFAEHFQNAFDMNSSEGNSGYIRSHYDYFPFCNGNPGKLRNSNIIGRLCNEFVAGINDLIVLPKIVLVVLEADMISAADHFDDRISQVVGPMIEWVVNEFH